MAHRLGGALLDLSLDLSSRRSIIDDDAELIVVNEEAPSRSLAIGVERDSLDGQITNVSADHHANEAEQTARNR